MSRALVNSLVKGSLWLGGVYSYLPRGVQQALSTPLGNLLYWLASPRRLVVMRNLSLCFPALSESQQLSLARRFFRNVARAFLDLFQLWRVDENKLKQMVRLENLEYFENAKEAFRKEGRPVIVFAPHFIGLDAGGARLQLEDQLVCLYSNQALPAIDAWIYKGRSRFNQPMLISRRDGIGPLVRALKKGVTAHFSPDMDLGRRGAEFVPFFGVPAATQPSIIRLAHLTNATVLPMVTLLTPRGYRARFYEPLLFPKEESLAQGLERIHAFIEARIQEAPDQYLWAHRRFKTRPEGLESVYPPKRRRN